MEKEEKDILVEIRDCYNDGLLSALVGAGFSKNVSDAFLGWGELLHEMVGTLYAIEIKKNYDNYIHQNRGTHSKRKTEKEIGDEYIEEVCQKEDYLEIVSNYIRKKGFRESVEVYIESKIPYASYEDKAIHLYIGNKKIETVPEPNFSAHKELLKAKRLQNIYTTNYENLLEITTELLKNEIVASLPKVVVSGCELSNKLSSSNIIKIHGNLRKNADAPFEFDGDKKLCYIIAKEDYETYKEKHEAFTALMRIAMLQGKFMLLGFSGSDANYKGWVSWMSDVLDSDSQDTKIYIIDVSGDEVSPELNLYYKNHHTKVLNLLTKERLHAIGFEDDKISWILKNLKEKKLDNENRRAIQTKFLKYLNEENSDCEEFVNSGSQINEETNETRRTSYADDHQLLVLSHTTPNSYDYRNLWSEVSSKIDDNNAIDDIIKKIKDAKSQNRFPKIIYNQDYIIDHIVRKSQIDIHNAFLLALAIDECGLNPHYYSRLINDYEELNRLPLWNLLKIKEETFNGIDSKLSGTDDEIIYENIQRNLFHLDFKKANGIITRWKPNGYFIVLKAMRLATQENQQDKAFMLLSDYISKEDNLSTKLYAMQIANYISKRYPWPYDTGVLYQYGVDGIGDMLNFMIQQLRGKVEAPKSRGWIGSTMNFGGSHTEYERSLRTLRFISDCGIYLNYGASCFFDKANWYLVFQNLYEEFPYPCFFYSIQYRDKDLLTRIGQDFAYSPKLCDFNQDILPRSIKAYGDEHTPSIFLTGLLYITGPMYFAVDENVWFETFVENILKEVLSCIDKYDLSDPLIKNVEYALNAIYHYDHVNQIMVSLISHYSKNSRLVDYLIRYCVHIEYLKEGISNDLWDTFRSLISDYPHIDITDLIFYLNQHNLITKEVLYLYIDKFKAAEIEAIPKNLVSSMHLCILTQGDANASEKAKDIFLNQDIWHCGIMIDGKGWTSPHYIRLAALKDQIIWSNEDFKRICTNLTKNIKLYDDAHSKLHEDSFMRNEQVTYLSDVIQFIDNLTPERKETLRGLRGRVEVLLNERINYNTLIEGMLSEQSMDVSYVIDNVVQGIVANGVSVYIDEFNFILDRAIMGEGLIINKMLDGVRLVVRNKPDEIVSLGFCPKLYTLLSIYKDRWLKLREFKPVWSFNYLYEIADFLNRKGYDKDEVITYWLADPFVHRFIRQ